MRNLAKYLKIARIISMEGHNIKDYKKWKLSRIDKGINDCEKPVKVIEEEIDLEELRIEAMKEATELLFEIHNHYDLICYCVEHTENSSKLKNSLFELAREMYYTYTTI